jgi:hypothetical protein
VVQVFDQGYLMALRPTVEVGVVVLFIGAVSALLLERRRRVRQAEVEPVRQTIAAG